MKRLLLSGSILCTIGAVAAVAAAAASASHGSTSHRASSPIKVGISLSLSGDFSDSGKAAMRGYDLWQSVVNKQGGILGRKVELKIVDDASSPNQVVTNYQNLITRDKVDLVFGPFSTLLTAPAARVAARYGYPFIEPAGGGPAVFQEKLHNVFFTQPAPVVTSADVFAHYILSLPKAKRPKTAAYPALDDPFSSPIADRVRELLSKAGIRTVFKTIYPAETTDMTPIVQKMIATKPDLIVGGTQNGDAFAIVKALVQLKYDPKFLFFSNGPNDPAEFPSKVGKGNVNGIFATGDWFPDAKNPGNPAFVKAYVAKYHGPASSIDPTSAEAFAVGQVAEAAIRKVGSVDNAKIISTLHKGSWPSVEGTLRWNSVGEPQGQDLLVQWVNGKLLPVYPPSIALHKPVAKSAWAG
jgi:branched-chain amino acid transport system substrate-binding protein